MPAKETDSDGRGGPPRSGFHRSGAMRRATTPRVRCGAAGADALTPGALSVRRPTASPRCSGPPTGEREPCSSQRGNPTVSCSLASPVWCVCNSSTEYVRLAVTDRSVLTWENTAPARPQCPRAGRYCEGRASGVDGVTVRPKRTNRRATCVFADQCGARARSQWPPVDEGRSATATILSRSVRMPRQGPPPPEPRPRHTSSLPGFAVGGVSAPRFQLSRPCPRGR